MSKFLIKSVVILAVVLIPLSGRNQKANVHALTQELTQSVTGRLIGLVEDDFKGGGSKEIYFIEEVKDGKARQVELNYEGVLNIPLGSQVKATGIKNQNESLTISPLRNI